MTNGVTAAPLAIRGDEKTGVRLRGRQQRPRTAEVTKSLTEKQRRPGFPGLSSFCDQLNPRIANLSLEELVRKTGLEPVRLLGAAPSRRCVCQFRHFRNSFKYIKCRFQENGRVNPVRTTGSNPSGAPSRGRGPVHLGSLRTGPRARFCVPGERGSGST